MKHIRIMMMIAVAIFMGTTFTSCLDSDNERIYSDWVVITEGAYGVSVVTDGGITLRPSNVTAMQVSSGGETYYPKRAAIYYTLPEGTVITEGATEYNIVFSQYAMIPIIGTFAPMEVASATPLVKLDEIGFGSNYLDVIFTHYYNTDTDAEDFSMYAESADNNTLYVKLVQTQEIEEQYNSGQTIFTFPVPYRYTLEALFPQLEPFGATGDSIYVKVRAEGANSTVLEKEPLKIKIR